SEDKTTYAYRNISVCVDGFYNAEELHFIIGPVPYAHSTSSTIMPFTVTMPDFTTPNDDTYGIRETLYPGYRALNEGQRAEQLEVGFYSCHLEGSSRGIILYVNWAVINY
ncbi:MAG: hypothetical protein NTY95_00875, partial [Bacteroidia bacterium]|nr:hypothetical protein [Bacteroidia bacterium]